MQQLVLFDYNSLDTDTRTFVQEKAQAIHTRLKRTAEDIIAIGLDLTAVKDRLGHGKYEGWLRSEFEMSLWTANKFVQVATRFKSVKFTDLDFPVSVLYELAAPSTSNMVIEMVETGQIPATLPAIREAKQQEQIQSTPEPTHLNFLGLQEEHEKEEEEEQAPPRLTEENRYFNAIDNGTLEHYYNDLRRDAIQQDRERREEVIPTKSATLSALQSSDSNEWYTPQDYVNAARELMGAIDVDPASCELANQTVKAIRFYAKEDNGLNQSWAGRVWLNPPYGVENGVSNQDIWANQLIERYQAGLVSEAVLLVNANTEAKWFQPLYDYLICLTNHRIRFYNSDGVSSQPTQGNALIYLGKQRERFIKIFSQFGTVVRKASANDY